MSADDWASPYRRWFRRIQLTFSILLLTAMAVLALSGSAVLNELALWIGFLLPGLLGLAVLISSGLDVYVSTREGTRLIQHTSRWLGIGKLVLAGVIWLLAVATLFFVIQTILIVTVIDTGGGVIFGPILWMVTGSALAIAILFRFAGETLLSDDAPIHLGKSCQ